MTEPHPSPNTTNTVPTQTEASEAAPAGSSGSLRYGRFALQRFHARGGLGEVHVAVDEELKRAVALKRMRERCVHDPAARRRFLNEAEITARLEHPGIVPIYGLTQDEHGQPCYAMRFIQGESLKEAIRRFHGKPAPPPGEGGADQGARRAPAPSAPRFDSLAFRQLLQRFVSVCQTVAYAHSKQVIHRDLKPANVMLGAFGETLVVDWGLARHLPSAEPVPPAEGEGTATFAAATDSTEEKTLPGQALGTPAYMAPEQAAGRWNVVGPRSDIYSLGATLYELTTGQGPVSGQDVFEALQKAQAGDFPPPRKVQPGLPKALEAICLKAMARNPEDRYAAAADLAGDVEHWLADEPLTAYAEPWHERLRRWARRRLAWLVSGLAATTAVLVLAVVGLAVVSAARQRERTAREAETEARAAAQVNAETAEHRFRLARQEVDDWFVAISESPELRATPQGRTLRRHLLEKARGYYEQFLREKADAPELLEDTAGAYFRLAEISHELDPGPATLDLYVTARDRLETLLREHPERSSVRRHLAAVYINLGTVYREVGRPADAEAAYEEALRLLAAFPETSTVTERASTLVNLGVLHMGAGRADDGVRSFEQARALFKGLADAHPEQRENRKQLAATTFNLGRAYHLRRQMSRAGEYLTEARDLQKKLVEAEPADDGAARDLAKTYHYLAVWHKDQGHLKEALAGLDQADRLWARLAQDHPQVIGYRVEHANNHREIAEIHSLQGRSTDALAALAQAEQVLEPVVRDHPAVTEYAQGLAQVYSAVGFEETARGRNKEAAAAFQRAADVLAPRLHDQPGNTALAVDLATDHRNLGKVLGDLGKKDESRSHYDQARRLLEKLHHDQPRDPQFAKSLASLYSQLGVGYVGDGHLDEAQAVYEQAVALLEELARRSTGGAAEVAELAEVSLNYGILQRRRGRLEDAERLVKKAHAAQERLVRAQPTHVGYAQNLAAMEFTLGDLLRDQKKPEAALSWYSRSVDRLNRLRDRGATTAEVPQYLLFAHTGRAQALTALMRHAEARKDWEQCLALAPKQYQPYYRQQWMTALARSGEHVKAAAAAEEAVKSPDAAVPQLYSAARTLALCAAEVKGDSTLADRYAARAVQLLGRALDKGFAGLEQLQKDDDLSALRGREDFRKLLERLAGPRR